MSTLRLVSVTSQRSLIVVMPQFASGVAKIATLLKEGGITVDPEDSWARKIFDPSRLADLQQLLPGRLVEAKKIEERPYVIIGVEAEDLMHKLYAIRNRVISWKHEDASPGDNQLRDICWWPESDAKMEWEIRRRLPMPKAA